MSKKKPGDESWKAFLKKMGEAEDVDAFLAQADAVLPTGLTKACNDASFRAWAFAEFVRPRIEQAYEGTPFKEAASTLALEMLQYKYSGDATRKGNESTMKAASDALFTVMRGDEAMYQAALKTIAGFLEEGLAQAEKHKPKWGKGGEPQRRM